MTAAAAISIVQPDQEDGIRFVRPPDMSGRDYLVLLLHSAVWRRISGGITLREYDGLVVDEDGHLDLTHRWLTAIELPSESKKREPARRLAGQDRHPLFLEREGCGSFERRTLAGKRYPFANMVNNLTANAIRLGDGALSLNPVSSSGVQKAIQSALAGAIVSNSLLRRPEAASDAQAFCAESLARTTARHAQWAGEHYAAAARSRSHEFWTARARSAAEIPAETVPPGPDAVLTLSPLAELRPCTCLGEEFVEVKQALLHPALDGPVAYLDRQPLAPALPPEARIRDLALQSAVSIASWLTRKGVLVAQAGAAS